VIAGAWAVEPHNLYIYLLTSAGLVGLIPFLLFLGSIGWLGLRGWWRTGRSPDGDQGRWTALLGTLLAYAVFAYTFDVIYAQLASMLLFLVVGVVLAPQDASSAEVRA
jgi:O-antigen ligase